VGGGGPHQRQGRQRRPDRFHRGGTVSGAQSGLKASTEGGGSFQGHWSGVRRSGVEKKPKGRWGVWRPHKRQPVSGLGTWRGEIWGPRQRREA
jgi:hypothetical protein